MGGYRDMSGYWNEYGNNYFAMKMIIYDTYKLNKNIRITPFLMILITLIWIQKELGSVWKQHAWHV